MTQNSSRICCCVQMKVVPKVLFLPSAALGCHRAEVGTLPKTMGKTNKQQQKPTHLFFPLASSLSRTQQDTAGASKSPRFPQSNTIDGPVHAAEADGSEPYNNKPYNQQLGLDALLLLTTALWCSSGPALAGIASRFILLGQFSCC